jgi:hypothetical protein
MEEAIGLARAIDLVPVAHRNRQRRPIRALRHCLAAAGSQSLPKP